MQKIIQTCALVFMIFLTIGGIYFPHENMMQLTSMTDSVIVLRALIATGVVVLLFTTPPRRPYVRFLLGIASTVLLTWAGYQTYNENIQMLDGLVFLIAGIGFGLAALEMTAAEAKLIYDSSRA